MLVNVYLDLSDLYHRVNRQFGRKINFAAAMDRFKDLGTLHKVVAFGIQQHNEASGFITCLRRLGYETRFKKPEIIKCGDRELKRSNWDVDFTLDASFPAMPGGFGDLLTILGTGSANMVSLVKVLQPRVRLFTCCPSRELLKTGVSTIEIDEGLLE